MQDGIRMSTLTGSKNPMLPPLTDRNSHMSTDGRLAKSIDLSSGCRHHVTLGASDRHLDGATICSSDHSGSGSVEDLFEKASIYLDPGRCFRRLVYLYGERKLMVFFLVHFSCTMIVFLHFAMSKFEHQRKVVPEGAPLYWLKRMAPTLEFGTMHAILLQMALLPLTMTRYSIASLSETFLDKYIPFKRTLRMHIHLGYTMILTVFAATVFFFFFFGILCRHGEQAFCEKFTTEIMATGYAIFLFLLVIGASSYMRDRIPYEVFYVVHHLIGILYIVTIMHTFDVEARSGRANRSQTFKWFSATTLFYVCDRLAMYMTRRYRTRLMSSSTVLGSDGSKMMILNLRKPTLFSFKPGQYAYLKIASIDNHWHPFSISSDPSSDTLEFYVEVFGPKSWTAKLWNLIEEDAQSGFSARYIDVELMGPIGTELANTDRFSHILAIGTGSGIVPILSMFKQQVNQLLRLDPVVHRETLERHRKMFDEIAMAEACRRGSMAQHLVRLLSKRKPYMFLRSPSSENIKDSIRCSIAKFEGKVTCNGEKLRTSRAQMKSSAFRATRSIYGGVALCCIPAVGISLIGLIVSWNTIETQITERMVFFLKLFTVGFQFCFASLSMVVWDATEFLAFIDLAIVLITPFADWYWLPRCQEGKSLRSGELVLYGILTGYMVLRMWGKAVSPHNRSWRSHLEKSSERTIERTDVVWICRSASLVSARLAEIEKLWTQLSDKWGALHVDAVCRITIHVTDSDDSACSQLKQEISSTALYNSGRIKFGRPDLPSMVRAHTVELAETREHSHTLLAYVGSPTLAQEIHHHKVKNDVVCAITGYNNHQMEYVSDCHGGAKSFSKPAMDTPDGVAVSGGKHPSRRIKKTFDHPGPLPSNGIRSVSSRV